MRTSRALKSAGGATDQQGRQLARLGAKMGNQQMAKGGGADSARDRLLDFIVQRLRRIQRVQHAELMELGREREWFREVATGKAGWTLPDPTRWHEATLYFKEAADAFSRGHLEQGAQKLERALDAEQAATRQIPEMVADDLEGDALSAGSTPSELPMMMNAGILPPCALPRELDVADRILAIDDHIEKGPPHRAHRRHNWWEPEEEDAEEKKENKDEAKTGATPSQAAAEVAPASTEQQEPAREAEPKEMALIPERAEAEPAPEGPSPAAPKRPARGRRRGADD